MLVSVIIPVFKVSSFIERCARSLFEQTLQDVEYIFVDDASPDDSIEILKRCIECYPQRKEHVLILTHEQNKGLPAARNTGLAVATGEYVFHCDSDDWVELTMLEDLYLAAKEADADIVWCDWYLSFAQNERYMRQPEYSDCGDALRGMLSGAMKYNVWNKLIRREIYTKNDIGFPSGHSMGEDMTIMKLFVKSDKVRYVPKALYHYVRTNVNAYTQTYSERHLADLRYNVDDIVSYITVESDLDLHEELNFFKLNVKLPFLISINGSDYSLWKEWYPEANEYIMKNSHLGFRSRLLQWMAWKRQWWFVRAYYVLVYRLVYGIIYK